MLNPEPTKRSVVDLLRRCNQDCLFCYYRHRERESVRTLDAVCTDIDDAKRRGNEFITFTGGEPTLHPDIMEICAYAMETVGPVEIITNCMATETIQYLWDIGVKDWLVSLHGLEEAHDFLVQRKGARKKQEDILHLLRGQKNLRVNCVVNKHNQDELYAYATYLVETWKPSMINFINFNPHHEWRCNQEESADLIPDLRRAEHEMDIAIHAFERAGIGVNLRYYPMCRVAEEHRRCISNDLHVAYDHWEWDYSLFPKTFEVFNEWAQLNSEDTEEKGRPCCVCDLFMICGGINKYFNEFTEGKMVDAVTDFEGDKADFYWYRRDNVMTLEPRK